MAFAESLSRGKRAEAEAAKHAAAMGWHVIHVFRDDDPDAVRCGPRVVTSGGLVAAADLLCVRPDGGAVWLESKAKTVPGYRYQTRTWEHGVDARLFLHDYAVLAERAPLFVVVREDRTLPSEGFRPPDAPRADGKRDWTDYQRHLVDGPVWLRIAYEDARRTGRRQEPWSGRKAGWLWPRDAMTRLEWGRPPAAPTQAQLALL